MPVSIQEISYNCTLNTARTARKLADSLSSKPSKSRNMAPSEKQTFKSANDGPLELIVSPLYRTGNQDQFTKGATEMTCVHNMIIRGFNSIYQQALNIPEAETTNFIHYSLCWWDFLHHHHGGEETSLFPEIERQAGEKGLMDANVSQHEAFEAGLRTFHDYLVVCLRAKTEEQRYSGKKLIAIMDSFKDVLRQHLADEIPTLLSLERFGDKIDLLKIMSDEAETVMGGMSKVSTLPFCFLNHDVTYENGLHASFPPIPLVVRWVLCKLCTCWNWRWWKFASCDKNGMPKGLPYA